MRYRMRLLVGSMFVLIAAPAAPIVGIAYVLVRRTMPSTARRQAMPQSGWRSRRMGLRRREG